MSASLAVRLNQQPRTDELEADRLAVQLLIDSGYDPQALIEVMDVLEQTSRSAIPEFFSTHPSPKNRKEKVREAIQQARR